MEAELRQQIEQLRQQIEILSRNQERHSAELRELKEREIRELKERTEEIREFRRDMRLLEQGQARLEERVQQILIQIENQQKMMASWKNMFWALLMLLLGGFIAAGFELFKR